MPANASIYLPTDKIDLKEIFTTVKSNGGLFKRDTSFEVEINGDVVTFNLMPRDQIANHIKGFAGYINSLDEEETRKQDACLAIQQTKSVLGLVTNREFQENPEIWASLFKIASQYDGYIFVYDSVVLPNGGVIVGPLKNAT